MFCKATMPLNQHTHHLNFPKQIMSSAKEDSNLVILQNGNEFLELGCTEVSCILKNGEKTGNCRTTKGASRESSPDR